jgi:hypothetical protein
MVEREKVSEWEAFLLRARETLEERIGYEGTPSEAGHIPVPANPSPSSLLSTSKHF